MGEIVSKIPARALWAEWDKNVYIDPPLAKFEVDGRPYQDALTQFSVDVEQSDENGVLLLLEGPRLETRIQFKIAESPQFSYRTDEETKVELVLGRRGEDLVDYLNDSPLNLMLDDWSKICGEEHFPAPAEPYNPFDRRSVSKCKVDWQGGGSDIRVGVWPTIMATSSPPRSSFFLSANWMSGRPMPSCFGTANGSGEAADFVVLRPAADGGVNVTLYHSKGWRSCAPATVLAMSMRSAHRR